MITPNGTINRDNLAINNNFSYEGSASSLYFYAKTGGGNVTVNGAPFTIVANRYYLFTGNIQVKVTRNDPTAPGKWMVCITTNVPPTSGIGANRPLSPCEQGLNAPQTNPTQQTRPNKPPTIPTPNPRQTSPEGRTNPGGATKPNPGSGGNSGREAKPTPPPAPPKKEEGSGRSESGGKAPTPPPGGRRPNNP